MTTFRLRIATAGLITAGIGGVVAATTTAAAAVPTSADSVISFTEHNLSDQSFNLGSRHGFAVGYVELVANKLMRGARQIGHDGESYTVTRLGSGSADEEVLATEVFAGGQIDLSGLVTSTPHGPGTFQLAVIGGTGSYRGAEGYATVVPGKAPIVTIHLR